MFSNFCKNAFQLPFYVTVLDGTDLLNELRMEMHESVPNINGQQLFKMLLYILLACWKQNTTDESVTQITDIFVSHQFLILKR